MNQYTEVVGLALYSEGAPFEPRARTPDILTEVSRGFSVPPANSGIKIPLDHNASFQILYRSLFTNHTI
jgi:hypothetical protein